MTKSKMQFQNSVAQAQNDDFGKPGKFSGKRHAINSCQISIVFAYSASLNPET